MQHPLTAWHTGVNAIQLGNVTTAVLLQWFAPRPRRSLQLLRARPARRRIFALPKWTFRPPPGRPCARPPRLRARGRAFAMCESVHGCYIRRSDNGRVGVRCQTTRGWERATSPPSCTGRWGAGMRWRSPSCASNAPGGRRRTKRRAGGSGYGKARAAEVVRMPVG